VFPRARPAHTIKPIGPNPFVNLHIKTTRAHPQALRPCLPRITGQTARPGQFGARWRCWRTGSSSCLASARHCDLINVEIRASRRRVLNGPPEVFYSVTTSSPSVIRILPVPVAATVTPRLKGGSTMQANWNLCHGTKCSHTLRSATQSILLAPNQTPCHSAGVPMTAAASVPLPSQNPALVWQAGPAFVVVPVILRCNVLVNPRCSLGELPPPSFARSAASASGGGIPIGGAHCCAPPAALMCLSRHSYGSPDSSTRGFRMSRNAGRVIIPPCGLCVCPCLCHGSVHLPWHARPRWSPARDELRRRLRFPTLDSQGIHA